MAGNIEQFAVVGDTMHILHELLGWPETRSGPRAILHGVCLVEQTFDDVPDQLWAGAPSDDQRSVKAILQSGWPEGSRFRNLRRAARGLVLAELIPLDYDDRYFVGKEWGLGPWGWTELGMVNAELSDGTRLQAVGMVLRAGQGGERIEDGLVYPLDPLNDPAHALALAQRIGETRHL